MKESRRVAIYIRVSTTEQNLLWQFQSVRRECGPNGFRETILLDVPV